MNRLFELISWIPPALWIAAHVYVSQFEGWGAWAAAPILLGPLVVSLVIGLFGAGLFVRRPVEERKTFRVIAVLVLAWIPILHVLASNIWRSATSP